LVALLVGKSFLVNKMKRQNYIVKISEPGQNKCSSCAKRRKDYEEKRRAQHEFLISWLNEVFKGEMQVLRSDGKTGFLIISAPLGMATLIESGPDVIAVKTQDLS
jgi:hypothetical protein